MYELLKIKKKGFLKKGAKAGKNWKRNKLYYHRNKSKNEEDKDVITKDIILVKQIC